jgi:hypothetical protein
VSEIRPDAKAAVEFPSQFLGEAPWPLTAVRQDRKGIESARTFEADKAEAESWITEKNESGLHVYFSVNPLKQPLGPGGYVKASKNDIAAARWLWVDADPPNDTKNLAADQAEIDRLIADLDPAPTCVVDSGRGRWAFWELSEPIVLDGARGKATKLVEEHGEGVEKMLYGFADSCRNVDRIARLPGTINWKTKQLARLVEHRDGLTFSLCDLPRVRRKDEPEVDTADDLGSLGLSKELVKLLEEPDYSKWKSRSEALFHAVCSLIRAGVSDAMIVAIQLDSRLKIGEQVREKHDPTAYTWRQLRQALRKQPRPDKDFVNKDGRPLSTSQENVRTSLAKLGAEVAHDRFSDLTTLTGLPGFGPELDDAALDRIWLLLDERYEFRPSPGFLRTVVLDAAQRHRFHPVRDYLDDLEWDGISRADAWLTTYAGAEDNEYVRAVGSLFLVAAVRRVRHPGCKFDEMLVLESPTQGTDKSSAIRALAVRDEWFTDSFNLSAKGKEVIEALQGRWIVEVPELSGE